MCSMAHDYALSLNELAVTTPALRGLSEGREAHYRGETHTAARVSTRADCCVLSRDTQMPIQSLL